MAHTDPQDNGQIRVTFASGPTDNMPLDMAEFILHELYGLRRDLFARYAAEYWKRRAGRGQIVPK